MRFAILRSVILPLSLPLVAAIAGDPPAPVPLPPLNARVAGFARAHEGRAVGDGICITLAVAALRDAGARRFPLNDPAGEYVWGEPVADLKAVLPGDILQFRDVEFGGTRISRGRRETWHESYPHHTAIVVATAENARLVTIAHQNVAVAGDDPGAVGRVRATTLRMNALRKGTVRAYRPAPPEPATNPAPPENDR